MSDINIRPEIVEILAEEMQYTLEKRLDVPEGLMEPKFAQTWVAKNEGDRRDVVKISGVATLDDFGGLEPEKLFELMEREKEILTEVGTHPNIPNFIDFQRLTTSDGLVLDVLAMEYMAMPSLQSWIDGVNPFTQGDAQFLSKGILDALAFCHSRKIPVIHRDTKPGNILYNGNEARLVDFNLSCFDHPNESRRTRIVNGGYLPVDAYTGNPKPHHDLYGFGVCLIAAGFGKDIGALRAKQGLDITELPNIGDLDFKTTMQHFIRKLTASEGKLRYQDGTSAFSVFNQLESVNEAELMQSASLVTRGKGIDTLLGKLKELDPLYNYHVTPSLLADSDDSDLLDHLARIYSVDTFVVKDPFEIEEYAVPQDRFRMVSPKQELLAKVEEDGIVKRVDGDTLYVKFQHNNSLVVIDINDIYCVGRIDLIGYNYSTQAKQKWCENPKKRGIVQIKSSEDLYQVLPIEAGVEGIILEEKTPKGNDKRSDYLLVAANGPGVQRQVRELYFDNGRLLEYDGKRMHTAEEFHLLIPNPIDFEALKLECLVS